MSVPLSRRVAALEQAGTNAPALRVVIAEIGESAEEALRREGVDPDAGQRVVVVVFG